MEDPEAYAEFVQALKEELPRYGLTDDALAGIDPVVKAIDAARGVADSAGALREPLATIKTIMVDTLGIQPDWVLPIVLVAGGIYIMYWRKRQRDEGRA